MRILLLHNYYRIRGGEDVVFESEWDLLLQHGHQVETYTVKSQDDMGGVQKIKTALQGFYNYQNAKAISQKIKTFKPDVIHVHNFFPLLSPAIFEVAASHNIPIVMTLHNFRLMCPQAQFLRDGKICMDCIDKPIALPGIQHKCYKDSALATAINTGIIAAAHYKGVWQNKVDRYIVLNPYIKSLLQKSSLNIASEKLTVKPNFCADFGYSTEKMPYVLFVGRLSEEKGIDLLLKAFEKLPYQLKIAGTGPLETLVQTAATQNNNIEYLGFQQREQVMSLLKEASILAFSSIWLECCPMTILESLSSGTPVIAPNQASIEHFVKHQHNGLIYETGNVDALAAAITMYFSDTFDRAALVQNARLDWEQYYSPESGYNNLIQIYEDVVNLRRTV